MYKHFSYFLFFGLSILIIGLLFYMNFRPESLFIEFINSHIGEVITGTTPYRGHFIGSDSLPSFIHTLSFCLLTAAFINLHKSTILLIGIFWVFVNTIYELYAFTEHAKEMPLQFHGDIYDILASLLGALVFVCIAVFYLRKEHKGERYKCNI